jgi:hypothetical protein
MNKKIWLTARLLVAFASAVTLEGCSQYPDTVMLCKGSVSAWVNGHLTAKVDDQSIGMHISNDRISLTGSSFLGVDNQKVCRIASNEYAKKDELVFDTDGCQMKGKSDVRQYGTYNFITRHLAISNHMPPAGLTWADGDYECSEAR